MVRSRSLIPFHPPSSPRPTSPNGLLLLTAFRIFRYEYTTWMTSYDSDTYPFARLLDRAYDFVTTEKYLRLIVLPRYLFSATRMAPYCLYTKRLPKRDTDTHTHTTNCVHKQSTVQVLVITQRNELFAFLAL